MTEESSSQGHMEDNNIPVIKLGFSSDWKALSDAISMARAYEVQEFTNASELITYLGTETAGLLICSLKSKEDLIQIATLMKLSKKLLKDSVFRVVVINFAHSKQFEAAINKLGIQDLVEPNVAAKSLRFKLDLWMKALRSQAKKMQKSEVSVKTTEAAKKDQPEKKVEDKGYNSLPPLTIEDDMWLQHKDFEIKKILGRWLVRVMGPGPLVGQWTEVTGKANLWKFVFKGANEKEFLSGKGQWFYRGDHKPEFNTKENMWYMTGDNLELFYDDGQICSRLQLKDKQMSVAANSRHALNKQSLIISSFDKEVVFKKDVQKTEELDIDGSENENQNTEEYLDDVADLDLPGPGLVYPTQAEEKTTSPLAGKGKTEEINHDPLAGKVDSSQSAKSKDGNLQGKNQTDNLGGGLNGKGKTDKINQGELSGKLNTEEQASLDPLLSHKASAAEGSNKNPSLNQATEQLQGLNGKGKTDHLKHKDLAGKGQPADDVGSEELGLNPGQSKSAGPLKGKATTQNLTRPGMIGTANRAANTGSLLDYDNKQHTHETKYKGHMEAEKYDAVEGRKNQYQEEEKEGLAGKTSTDKVKKNYDSRENGKVLPFASPGLAELKQELEQDPDAEMQEATQSGTVIVNLMHEKSNINCELDDFFDNNVIFRMPEHNFLGTDVVTLDMRFDYLGETTFLMLPGKMVANDVSDGTSYITVELKPDEVEEFETFMKVFKSRQQNVEVFMKRVKGY